MCTLARAARSRVWPQPTTAARTDSARLFRLWPPLASRTTSGCARARVECVVRLRMTIIIIFIYLFIYLFLFGMLFSFLVVVFLIIYLFCLFARRALLFVSPY